TYEEDRPGRILKYSGAFLRALTDGAVLSEEMASAKLDIPSYAQGAAVEPSGRLWISRSQIGWGYLENLGPAGGRVERGYAVPGGIEGIAFDAAGRLWGVSEAGARHLRFFHPFFPLIFGLDLRQLEQASAR